MSYILLQHVSNTKKGSVRGLKRHFSLSLSGNFALWYVQTTREAGFYSYSFYYFFIFKEYYFNFSVHL